MVRRVDESSTRIFFFPRTINNLFTDICWIRLDFDKFELSKQTSELINIDSFTITESDQIYNYPILAGTNTGQHGKP